MGGYDCETCGDPQFCEAENGECGACSKWVCPDCWYGCDGGCSTPVCCPACAVAVAAREWACCGTTSEARTYHPECFPGEEAEEEHGCVACEACGNLTCPAVFSCLSCDAAAEEEDQAPLRVADVRVVLDALAAAKSDSLRAVLQGWLEKHVGAAGAAVGKKRKA